MVVGVDASSPGFWRGAETSVVDAAVSGSMAAGTVVSTTLLVKAVSRRSAWANRWPRWISGR